MHIWYRKKHSLKTTSFLDDNNLPGSYSDFEYAVILMLQCGVLCEEVHQLQLQMRRENEATKLRAAVEIKRAYLWIQ